MFDCSPGEYLHYQRWYNMQEGDEKQETSPLLPSFSSLLPEASFQRVQYIHFRTWCNSSDEEKQQMRMLLQHPPISNYAARYPLRESHPWDSQVLSARERYACWEEATVQSFLRVMCRKQVTKPLRKMIMEFLNPYTENNLARERIRAREFDREFEVNAERLQRYKLRRREEKRQRRM